MKLNTAFLFSFYFISCLSYAGWPLFVSPDKEFLLAQNYIDTVHCPRGMGRLANKQTIDIQPFCKTHCPVSWSFVTSSDDTCHDLTADFNLQKSDISHYHDSEGTTLYSIVSLYYGEKNSSNSSVKLVFTTPEEHWYCIEADPDTHTITCANDI